MKKKIAFIALVILLIAFTITLNACKTATKKHNVSFNTNGGSDIASVLVEHGSTINELPTPNKLNLTFDYWCTDSALSQEFVVSMPITKNLTLYAKYVALVVYDGKGMLANTTEKVEIGAKINQPPIWASSDKQFIGWFSNQARTSVFDFSSVIIQNTFVYGEFDNTKLYNQYINIPMTSISEDGKINIIGATITQASLTKKVKISGISIDNNEILVSTKDGTNSITGFIKGSVYELTLLDEDLHFSDNYGTRIIVVKVNSPSLQNVKYNENIKQVLKSNVRKTSETAYVITHKANESYEVGDLLAIGSGTTGEGPVIVNKDKDTLFVEVVEASTSGVTTHVVVKTADPSKVYLSSEFSGEAELNSSELTDGINAAVFESEIKRGNGYNQIIEVLATYMSLSKSVKSASGYAFDGDNLVANDDKIQLALIELLVPKMKLEGEVKVSISSAKNLNFLSYDTYDFITMSVELKFVFNLQNSANKDVLTIEATVDIDEYFYGYLEGTSLSWADAFKIGSIPLNYAATFITQTEVNLNIFAYPPKEKDEKIDVMEEINKVLNSEGDAKSDNIIKKVNSLLESKGDDIELFEKQLAKGSINIGGVVDINLSLNFIVKVNFAAGISAHASLLHIQRIGVQGSFVDGFKTYSYSPPPVESVRSSTRYNEATRYELNLAAYGYIGLKAGLKATVTLSLTGMSELGEVGLYGELGAYVDVYGYIEFKLLQESPGFKNDLIIPQDAPEWSVKGTVYLELGIYFNIGLTARSNIFNAKLECELIEKKIPLLSFGTQNMFLEFDSDTFIMRSSRLNVYDQLTASFLDITTGDQDTRNVTSDDKIYITFNALGNNFFEYDAKSGAINRKSNIKPITYEGVFYDSSSKVINTSVIVSISQQGAFSVGSSPKDSVTFSLIYADPTVANENITKSTYKASYIIDIDGAKTTFATKHISIGKAAGKVDYSTFLSEGYYVEEGYTAAIDAPMVGDAEYVIKIRTKKYKVIFDYYNAQENKWVAETYLVKYGEVPTEPTGFRVGGDNGTYASFTMLYNNYIDTEFNIAREKFHQYGNKNMPIIRETSIHFSDIYNREAYTKADDSEVGKIQATIDSARASMLNAIGKDVRYYFKAEYKYDSYDITYVYNKDEINKTLTTSVEKYSSPISNNTLYEISGYKVESFSLQNDGSNPIIRGSLPMVTGETTYYANLTLVKPTLTVLNYNSEIVLATYTENFYTKISLANIMAKCAIEESFIDGLKEDGIYVLVGFKLTYGGATINIGTSGEVAFFGNATLVPDYKHYQGLTVQFNGGKFNLKDSYHFFIEAEKQFTGDELYKYINKDEHLKTTLPPSTMQSEYSFSHFVDADGEVQKNITIGTGARLLTIVWKTTKINDVTLTVNTSHGVLPESVADLTDLEGFEGGQYSDDFTTFTATGSFDEMYNFYLKLKNLVDYDNGVNTGHFVCWQLNVTNEASRVRLTANAYFNYRLSDYGLTLDPTFGGFEIGLKHESLGNFKLYDRNPRTVTVTSDFDLQQLFSKGYMPNIITSMALYSNGKEYARNNTDRLTLIGFKLPDGTILRRAEDSLGANEVHSYAINGDLRLEAVYEKYEDRMYEITFWATQGALYPENGGGVGMYTVQGKFGDAIKVPHFENLFDYTHGKFNWLGWDMVIPKTFGEIMLDEVRISTVHSRVQIKANYVVDGQPYVTTYRYFDEIAHPTVQLGFNQVFLGWYDDYAGGYFPAPKAVWTDEVTYYGFTADKDEFIDMYFTTNAYVEGSKYPTPLRGAILDKLEIKLSDFINDDFPKPGADKKWETMLFFNNGKLCIEIFIDTW